MTQTYDPALHVIVPREPTDDTLEGMTRAFRDYFTERGPYPPARLAYKAMIAAAPQIRLPPNTLPAGALSMVQWMANDEANYTADELRGMAKKLLRTITDKGETND